MLARRSFLPCGIDGAEKTMFKTKLDELGFLLAYPLQIFVVSPFCRFVFYGRMGAHAYLRRGTTGDFGRIGWIMSENRGIGRMHIGLMMDLVISFKITEQKLKS